MATEGLHAEPRTRAHLQALMEASPVGLMVFEASTGELISLNEETQRLLNLVAGPDGTFEELIPYLTYRHGDGREIPTEDLPLPRVLRTGETVREQEVVVHLPDGKSVPTLINAAPIFSEEREIIAVVVAFHDMTGFEEIERLKAQFLGVVRDELRTALTSIKDTAAAALDSSRELDAAEMRQLFRIIDQQADHMDGLISDLLGTAQTQSGAP